MTDKLSREELIPLIEEWFKYSHIGSFGQFTKCKEYEKCEQALEQIKSMLQPVPEEKSRIILCPSCGREWNLETHNACQCGASLEKPTKGVIR